MLFQDLLLIIGCSSVAHLQTKMKKMKGNFCANDTGNVAGKMERDIVDPEKLSLQFLPANCSSRHRRYYIGFLM